MTRQTHIMSSKIRTCISYYVSPICALICLLLTALFFVACSSEKFLNKEQHVLANVKVTCTDKNIKPSSYKTYLKQHPNNKWFTLFKVPLGIYCLSKADSIKGNKGLSGIWRKMGEAPVIYVNQLTQYSRQNIKQALYNQGYLHAEVDTLVKYEGHKVNVEYKIIPHERYYINQLNYNIENKDIEYSVKADSADNKLHRGMPLDLNQLSDTRQQIVNNLHNKGYYYINKSFISFDVDIHQGTSIANVTLKIATPSDYDSTHVYRQQHFRNINVNVSDWDENDNLSEQEAVHYRGINFCFRNKQKINKRVFISHIMPRPDSLYSEKVVQNTYSNISSLPIVSVVNTNISPVGNTDSLNLDINVYPAKKHSLALDIEGTNTAGNLGAALALTYNNKNLFHASELLSLKLRGAYEAITGLEGYTNQNYTEWSAEANLRFPTFLFPFLSLETKRRLNATSEAKIMYDTQDRPEFHRRVLTANWAYQWKKPNRSQWQNRLDLLSINYVYMPWISETFRKDYLEGNDPHYSVLRYSYENLFIVKTGMSFSYNSLRNNSNIPSDLYQTNGFQIKFGLELAGNILYALSKATKSKPNQNGSYNLFGIAYSQYAKVDFDFAKSVILSERNSLAFHAVLGLGLPYGNSTIMPYEKRYFAGGANSVRGWSVRELGPGAYKGKDGKIDFVTQTGNLKLDLSVEWRTFLLWKMHGAFFLDAGNVWNTRSYSGMEDGLFKFNTFYKQIAVSYGLGLRFNFNYFILRLDGGMKAINPAVTSGRLHYPITKPNFKRDFALHFAIGLPF